MHDIPLYQGIALLLSQCGVTSLRMFLPTFLYLLLLRFHDVLGSRCPEMVRELAAATPAWMLHDATLWTLGGLAILEYVALHNDDVREFLTSHFDRCAKAVFAFLATYSFISAEEANQVRQLLPQLGDAGEPLRVAGVAVGAAGAVALGAGVVTYGLATLRQRILEFVRAIDPDDSLRLNSLAARAEDSLCVLAVVLMVLIPLAALLVLALTFAAATGLRWWRARRERQHSHACAACAAKGQATTMPDAAERCPVCGAAQPEPRAIDWLGVASGAPVPPAARAAHRAALLRHCRCPLCAAPARGDACPRCGAALWEQGCSRADYAAAVTRDAMGIAVVGVFLSAIPVLGIVVTLVVFSVRAIRPLRVHLGWGAKTTGRLLFRFLRLCATIAAILLSAVPFAGLIVFVPYWLAFRRDRAKFLAAAGAAPAATPAPALG